MFISTNEPEHFNWHDAEIKSVYCENQKMIWKVDALNVLTSNSQNSESIDLRASIATVIFENYSIEDVLRYGFKKYQGGNLIEELPDEMLSHQEIQVLLDEIINNTNDRFIRYIHGIKRSTNKESVCINADIDLMTDIDVVCMDIKCDKFIVQWDRFEGKAWYWDRKQNS